MSMKVMRKISLLLPLLLFIAAVPVFASASTLTINNSPGDFLDLSIDCSGATPGRYVAMYAFNALGNSLNNGSGQLIDGGGNCPATLSLTTWGIPPLGAGNYNLVYVDKAFNNFTGNGDDQCGLGHTYSYCVSQWFSVGCGAPDSCAASFVVPDPPTILGAFPALDFAKFSANVASIISQAFPVAALAVGLMLGLTVLAWIVNTVGRAIRKR